MTSIASARERRRVREWYRAFAFHIEKLMKVYAEDCARRRKINDDNVTVPWKRCATHSFLYLYASRCPLCLEDAAVSTL